MSTSPLPLAVLYSGLAGTVLALIVATAQQRWQPRVFFLLALRLAIGWHFLFEGLHKIHSHRVGPTETSKPFTSEPYMRVAPGPIGGLMRRQFEDPEAVIAAKVRRPQDLTPEGFRALPAEKQVEGFRALPAEKQAEACPPAVAEQLGKMEEAARKAVKAEAEAEARAATAAEEKAVKEANEAEAKALKDPKADPAKVKADADKARAKAKADADKARADAAKKGESFEAVGHDLVTAARASYARWVYGVDARDAKVKFIAQEVPLTAPQRLAHLDWLREQLKAAEGRQSPGLGNGYGIDQKRAAEVRMDLLTAESDLARDANAFVAELRTGLNGGKAPEDEKPPPSAGQRMDRVTMWFLVVVGACLLAGLFTPVACVLGAGFLVTTYLLHPPFPWYPLPPNTEGNPLFVNKNVIECLALLVVATFPTGRWMGLDALLCRCVRGRREVPAA
ncbi:MAG: hypothetical protein C0501_16415 [Isosphaera sp.]|nr:hypothetical protein [Isosphaera sp.]